MVIFNIKRTLRYFKHKFLLILSLLKLLFDQRKVADKYTWRKKYPEPGTSC